MVDQIDSQLKSMIKGMLYILKKKITRKMNQRKSFRITESLDSLQRTCFIADTSLKRTPVLGTNNFLLKFTSLQRTPRYSAHLFGEPIMSATERVHCSRVPNVGKFLPPRFIGKVCHRGLFTCKKVTRIQKFMLSLSETTISSSKFQFLQNNLI